MVAQRDAFGAEITETLAVMVRDAFISGQGIDDDTVELIFRNELQQRFPDDTVLGEEIDDDETPWDGTGWIIDPIDGTTNFRAGVPIFCVAIARLVQHAIVGGWIVDPMRQASWCAHRGGGVTRSGLGAAPLEKLPETAGTNRVVLFSSRWRRHAPELCGHLVKSLDLKERTLGSAALEMLHVADGRASAGIWSTARVWDIAAATLILEESGVVPVSLDGSPLSFRGSREELRERRYSFLAGTGKISRDLHETIRRRRS